MVYTKQQYTYLVYIERAVYTRMYIILLPAHLHHATTSPDRINNINQYYTLYHS